MKNGQGYVGGSIVKHNETFLILASYSSPVIKVLHQFTELSNDIQCFPYFHGTVYKALAVRF